MSRQTFIFTGTRADDEDLAHLVEHAISREFVREEGSDPYIRLGPAAIYLLHWPARTRRSSKFATPRVTSSGSTKSPARSSAHCRHPAAGPRFLSTICRRSLPATTPRYELRGTGYRRHSSADVAIVGFRHHQCHTTLPPYKSHLIVEANLSRR